MTLKETPPPQITVQVPGRHSIEPPHPPLQSAVVGVDVLDMENLLLHPDTCLDIQGLVSNSSLFGHRLECFAPIRTEERILAEDRYEGRSKMLGIKPLKHCIEGLPMAVTSDQNGDLFGGKPRLGRFSPPFPCRPWQFPS